MIRRFLLCVFLWHCMIGGDAKFDLDYNGNECNMRLDRKEYYNSFQDMEFRSEKNGHPHYLWGNPSNNDKVLYCVRVSSEKRTGEASVLSLRIPTVIMKKHDIHSIQVVDRRSPSKGGYVSLLGFYKPHAYIDFRSKIETELDYVVIISGENKMS